MVNSDNPRSEDELRERHTETCPRISDPGSECLACEFAQILHADRSRHVRYMGQIGAAIGDRELTDSGEPARSDAQEIRRIEAARKNEWETVAEYEAVLRDFGYDFEDPDDCIDWLRGRLTALTEIGELLHGESEWTPEDAINAVRQLLPPDAECELL